jgi:hypothetical protein
VVRATGLSTLPSFFARILKCKEVYGFAFTTVLFISAVNTSVRPLEMAALVKAKNTLFLREKY